MRNSYRVEDNTVIVEVVSKGKIHEVLIDKDDAHLLEGKTLGMIAKGYTGFRHNKKAHYLHRVIMKPKEGMVVDHISGNRYDNRRCNLRVVTTLENNRNINNKLNHELPRNVSWSKQRECYIVRLSVNDKTVYCGSSKDLEKAKQIAKESRARLWGEEQ
ncbi:HNH endonuclease [Bacillus wiedmannii]|uniref:HNH endonuclease n=1 Tax=Bacillus wiedmannii TaxID=1890302 RepID=UPI000BF0C10F|nr:HNH endonuclease [Bacillus wiedmannii]PEM30198.1 hypothetical protein CN598_12800 [Bacillus wiedmannii]